MREVGAVRLYLRAHHWRANAVALLVMLIGAAWGGSAALPLPSMRSHDSATIPLNLMMVVLGISLCLSTLDGPMRSFEELATVHVERAARWYLGTLCGFGAVVVFVGGAVTGGTAVGLVLLRMLVVMAGASLLSGSLLGWRWAWTLPVAVFVMVSVYGLNPDGSYAWWYWPRQSPGSVACWGIAATALAAGIVGFAAFGSRGRGLQTVLRRTRSPRRRTTR